MQSFSPDTPDALAELITRALSLADEMGANEVGIFLNEALVRLTGHGIPPRG